MDTRNLCMTDRVMSDSSAFYAEKHSSRGRVSPRSLKRQRAGIRAESPRVRSTSSADFWQKGLELRALSFRRFFCDMISS
ncbi:hypothetical protein EVAR_7947_1 [Eumeta japonica]|uniref:Uncharacterized protein n=1 Tax=Eumeta variegata TaxID=151549 RepID=A0A4C1TJX4_EUMVA|nr:hypothetical protein EVAR_7947_1 [Eumeta japonica]